MFCPVRCPSGVPPAAKQSIYCGTRLNLHPLCSTPQSAPIVQHALICTYTQLGDRCPSRHFYSIFTGCMLKKDQIRKENWHRPFKACNFFLPVRPVELFKDCTTVRTLRSVSPILAVPPFKLMTVGDRSFSSAGPRGVEFSSAFSSCKHSSLH